MCNIVLTIMYSLSYLTYIRQGWAEGGDILEVGVVFSNIIGWFVWVVGYQAGEVVGQVGKVGQVCNINGYHVVMGQAGCVQYT